MDVFLATGRLALRPFTDTESDLDLVVELDSDPEVMRYLTGGHPMTREEIRAESFERMLSGGFWATQLRATGAFLGWHCLSPVNDSPVNTADLGYRLRRSAWGKGFATEGALALVRKGFGELGYDRIIADTMSVNARSRRVLEKCGLSYVRTSFEDWPDPIAGAEQGDVEYALTREEWLERMERRERRERQ
ncbi:GNAT family N-acetyltransferase [Streptomyces sp. NPDC057743]|uniref:GNAT family N-acetyltransferase n=1 Tax=Streptomyces sp. NPDC057743 TaxID=3346236 RepID=UPI0036747ABE